MSKELSIQIEKSCENCREMMKKNWDLIQKINEKKVEVNEKIQQINEKIQKITKTKKPLIQEIKALNQEINDINKNVVDEIVREANRNGLNHLTLLKILKHDSRFEIYKKTDSKQFDNN